VLPRSLIALLILSLSSVLVGASETEEVAAPAAAPAPVALVESSGDAAHYWPRWRGPSGQGLVSDEYDYPQQWSGQENVLWRVDLPGDDSSSPIVWEDKIFLTTAETAGDDRTRSILCYSTEDGSLLWKAEAPAPESQPTRRRTDRSISTPATDGERVYAYLGAHGLLAVDMEGNQVWHRNLGTFDHSTSSPLLHGDRIIIVQVKSQRKGSAVFAYEAKTGFLKKLARRAEMFASGTPIAIRVGDREQIVVSAQQYVRAYDADSLEEVWAALGTEQNTIPTPVVGLGMVYVTSGRAGATMAIHPTGKGIVTGSHVAWKVKETGPLMVSPVFYDGYLFVLDDVKGTLTCFDGGTGESIWSETIVDMRSGGLTASPVVVDGKLFVTDVNGNTHVFAAGPEFQRLGINRLGEEVRASPALSQGRWYFRTRRHLVAIGQP
jgi:outer membrane protein assembly factor BamB